MTLVVLAGACGTDVTIGKAEEIASGPPSFTDPDAGEGDAADGGLIAYCPSSKCPPGWTTCPSSRFPCDVNLRADTNNCGACGVVCPTGGGSETFSCIEGACAMKCGPGVLDCDGLADNGCEGIVRHNDHCGSCDKKCPDPEKPCSRQGGSEQLDCGCPSGLISCFGSCVDPKTDDYNCATCGNLCDPTGGGAPSLANTYYGCFAGECGAMKCATLSADCDGLESTGCETSLVTDENCGACGYACPNGESCRVDEFGKPRCMCPSGLTLCSTPCQGNVCGRCVDLKSDSKDCGACGVSCVGDTLGNAHTSCNFGTCAKTCNQGWADCNDSDVDGCEVDTTHDPMNCGGCGRVCDAIAGQACVAGQCVVEPCSDIEQDAGGPAR